MTEAFLFKKLVTRNNKYRTLNELNRALASYDLIVEVIGCYVSQTSSYVDITLSTDNTPAELFKYSCILFENDRDLQNNYTPYIAFIDRIEPNNFNNMNDSKLCYRLYITIDWWSTIIINDQTGEAISNICNNLEGDIDRAHVDDVFIDRNSELKYTLGYTLPVQEEIVDYFVKYSEPVEEDLFAYIFLNPQAENFKGHICSLSFYDNYSFPPALVVCLPVKGGVIQPFKYWRTSGLVEPTLVTVGTGTKRIQDIMNDEVICYFISSIKPSMFKKQQIPNTGDWLLDGRYDQDNIVNLTSIFNMEGNPDMILAPELHSDTLEFDITDFCERFENMWTFKPFVGGEVPTIPATYQDYLFSMPKVRSQAYCKMLFTVNGEAYNVDYSYASRINDKFICYYQVGLDNGGAILYTPTEMNGGNNKIGSILVGKPSLSKPVVSINDFAIFSGILQTISGASNTVARGAKISEIPIGETSAVLGTTNAANFFLNYAGSFATYIEQTQGEVNGVPSTELQTYELSTLKVIYSFPHNYAIIAKHIALYGYNTYLHPHEVLGGHKRKYFNYIKTKNALVNVPNYSEQIRKSIEEMFNNGVWLWNDVSNFMNFEVPNYPIIMEETNV